MGLLAKQSFHTVNWYKSYLQGNDATSLIKEQIYAYAESV